MIGFAKIIIILNMKSPILISFCLANLFIYFQAAKETGALQAAKSKLEKEVEELTWRLQLEKRIRVSFIIQFTITLGFLLEANCYREGHKPRDYNLNCIIASSLGILFVTWSQEKYSTAKIYLCKHMCGYLHSKKSTMYGNDENRISNLHFSF